ncbi:MAG: hypothetical protein U0944_02540, partial [Candidatus Moranbacteria bacterium]|nr:hypothetical protein [Candidatus Moranbacteria bacterium]
FIGHSLGASFNLKSDVDRDSKFIFVNPLVKKRRRFFHFVSWIRFLVFEGFAINKAVPVRYWRHVFKQASVLLEVDVLERMKRIPRENIIIIRGIYDDYFCDKESAGIFKAGDFELIEVEAGHDWNGNVAKAIADIIGNRQLP